MSGPPGAATAWQASHPWVRHPGSFPSGSMTLAAHAVAIFAWELRGVAVLLGLARHSELSSILDSELQRCTGRFNSPVCKLYGITQSCYLEKRDSFFTFEVFFEVECFTSLTHMCMKGV